MSSPNELTCAAATTREIGGDETPGPWTNVVTENLEKLGMELTLWNDTGCQDLIIRIDTDGCHVVPANVSNPCRLREYCRESADLEKRRRTASSASTSCSSRLFMTGP